MLPPLELRMRLAQADPADVFYGQSIRFTDKQGVGRSWQLCTRHLHDEMKAVLRSMPGYRAKNPQWVMPGTASTIEDLIDQNLVVVLDVKRSRMSREYLVHTCGRCEERAAWRKRKGRP